MTRAVLPCGELHYYMQSKYLPLYTWPPPDHSSLYLALKPGLPNYSKLIAV